MKTITISTQILDGNLGDGWDDNYSTATSLADYTEQVWSSDLADLADDYEIIFKIDVERNTSGSSRGVSVTVAGMDYEEAFDMENEVESLLTDEQTIWDDFCQSEIAHNLSADV